MYFILSREIRAQGNSNYSQAVLLITHQISKTVKTTVPSVIEGMERETKCADFALARPHPVDNSRNTLQPETECSLWLYAGC